MNQRLKTALLHSSLFLATLVTTTIAGASWGFNQNLVLEGWEINPAYSWDSFALGLPYSITFLLVITVHEFGHYFVARHYKLNPTLPYFLPMPPLASFIGTLGAVIRIRIRANSMKELFDVGLAGPIAGFVIAVVLLFYGFQTLPGEEYIYTIHEEYLKYENYEEVVYTKEHLNGEPAIVIGNNILFWLFENYVGDESKVPNHYELPHYPVIFAGYLALLLTALNLLPIGQLDGGHILFGLVGYRRHKLIASITFCCFLFYATLGMVTPGSELDLGYFVMPHLSLVTLMIALIFFCLKCLRLPAVTTGLIAVGMFTLEYVTTYFFPHVTGFSGWLLFAIIIGRFMPVMHPMTEVEEPLSTGRKILGWIALAIFILCWSPRPIDVII
jgi:membrane-associated protease RseP (regulator of RpoE activity)